MIKLLCFLLSLVTFLSFPSCSATTGQENHSEKSKIISFVRENEKQLAMCVFQNDFTSLPKNTVIQNINVKEDFVDFDCGGAGFGPETGYFGFYFSFQDDMTKIWCGPTDGQPLRQSGKGYRWQETGGDNTYYTENICGHFYYYEAFF